MIPKISFELRLRPRVFWISTAVLLTAVLIFYGFKEKMLRITAQEQLACARLTLEKIENRMIASIEIGKAVRAELAGEKEKFIILEKEFNVTLGKLKRETDARREAEAMVVMVSKEKMVLEHRLEELSKIPQVVKLERIVLGAPPALTGEVLVVNKEFSFLVVALGREHNLKLGDILSVYRSGEFIGKAVVERVEEEISAASVLPDWRNVEFKEKDVVKKL
ncbi:MAG: hypothetical protein ABH836_03935 [Candidatus Omnitrophota bacterium]